MSGAISKPLVSLHGACRESITFTLDIYVVFQYHACLKHLFVCGSKHKG